MIRRLPTVLALACAICAASFAACAITPGRAISFPVMVECHGAASSEPPGAFDSGTGWHVVLGEARIALAAILVRARGDDRLASLRGALLP
ncbi:MAG: hypothetical protein M3Y87_16560, partial [Myxococcota bacterium]|nr:hypothetical protein [Myxococcota bacterium]